jgi:hypothetical protein
MLFRSSRDFLTNFQKGAPVNFVDMRNVQFPNKRRRTEHSISLLSLSLGLSRCTICALRNVQMIRCADHPPKNFKSRRIRILKIEIVTLLKGAEFYLTAMKAQ